jgi:TetR/AcrR family tetracycline transcriptional repressor
LTLEQVLHAAQRIVRRQGVNRLIMRGLATELGVTPNALYGHVASKAALIDALLDAALADVERPEWTALRWRDGLMQVMTATRKVLVEHHELVGLYISRGAKGPNATELRKLCFGMMEAGGIRGEAATSAFRALLIFTLGFAAFEASRGPAAHGVPDQTAPTTERGAALASRSVEPPPPHDFVRGLEWLLDGIQHDAIEHG